MIIIEHAKRSPLRVFRHNHEIRCMVDEILPRDKSWQAALLAIGLAAGCAVLFVRWWLCV